MVAVPIAKTAQPQAVAVAGIPVAVTDLASFSAEFLSDVAKGRGRSVRLVNAYSVALASRRADYFDVLTSPGVNLPDGASIVAVMPLIAPAWRANLRQVRGPSFFSKILDLGVAHGLNHYFVGDTPETLERMVAKIRERHPGIRIDGAYSPPFRPLDESYIDDVVTHVAAARPDVVWVGLGTPKQDFVSRAITERTKISAVGVGVAFAFLAGAVPEAPRWVQGSGFEWLFRLAVEPRRLWRRYVFGNARFLLLILQQVLGRRSAPPRSRAD